MSLDNQTSEEISEIKRTYTGILASLNSVSLRRQEAAHMKRSEKLELELSNNSDGHDLLHRSCRTHADSAS